MKKLLFSLMLLALLSCNDHKKENPAAENDTSTIAPAIVTDTTIAPPSGKIDIESFGPVKIGQPFKETLKALGEPDEKTVATEWGADGLLHEDWTWISHGLKINLSSEKTNISGSMAVFSINASAPCTFKTLAGIGIGSSYEDIVAAYPRDINKEESSQEQVTIGSVYGGIIFTLQQNKVNHIFLGAAAE